MVRCVGEAASRIQSLRLYKAVPKVFRLDFVPVILLYVAAFAFWWAVAPEASDLPPPPAPVAGEEHELSAAEKELSTSLSMPGIDDFDPDEEGVPSSGNADEEDEFTGPEDVTWLVLPLAGVLHVLIVLSQTWSVSAKIFVGFSQVTHAHDATHVLAVPQPNCGSPDVTELVPPASQSAVWSFTYQFARYVCSDIEDGAFQKLAFPLGHTEASYLSAKGLAGRELEATLSQYGQRTNELKLPSPTFQELFIEHITAPFFVFQLFCVGMWLLDEYVYYTLFTLGTLFLLECTLVWQRLRQHTSLRAMRPRPAPLLVFRNETWGKLDAEELLPGDVVSICRDLAEEARRRDAAAKAKREAAEKRAEAAKLLKSGGKGPDGKPMTWAQMQELWKTLNAKSDAEEEEGTVCPADILLLAGGAVANEAMLTGESVPHRKDAVQAGMCGADVPSDDPEAWLKANAGCVVMGGTTVLTHTSPSDEEARHVGVPLPPDGGAVGFVLRTGFYTSQGDLLRTIQFSTKRVTVDNAEAYYFILLLLVFAVSASGYVLHMGLQDPARSRYKLLLHCIMIVTSVVPPELPVQLAMAVNASLTALVQKGVFCTEPFRIPMAGKVEVAAFDKTGTLTTDKLHVLGLAGVAKSPRSTVERGGVQLAPVIASDSRTLAVLAGCHSLLDVDGELVGDPLEVAVFHALGWGVAAGDVASPLSPPQLAQLAKAQGDAHAVAKVPAGKGTDSVQVLHRWPFSSALRRMTALVACRFNMKTETLIVTKGAPEVIQERLVTVPPGYKDTYTRLSLSGARVLALAYKAAPHMSSASASGVPREDVESGLTAAGFLVLECPLKSKSAEIVADLQASSHHVVMITGDNPLTAISVAREVGILPAESSVQLYTSINDLTDDEKEAVDRASFSGLVCRTVPVLGALGGGEPSSVRTVSRQELQHPDMADRLPTAVTGAALEALAEVPELQAALARRGVVFARVSPDQKGAIIAAMNAAGYPTLMCGDGTNDVGALKQATVGISIISSPKLEKVADKLMEQKDEFVAKRGEAAEAAKASGQPRAPKQDKDLQEMQKALMDMKKELDGEMAMVKFGDASVAAPFTSKSPSIAAAKDILRQGRCTLVATHQMFQILAVNSLVASYQLSVLFLYGVRMGDTQQTIVGMSMAACFFAVSWAKPLDKLAPQRPFDSVFNTPLLVMVFGQFFIHLAAMLFTVHRFSPYMGTDITLDGKFEPNVINSVMFLLTWAMQTTTFAVNYHGEPFMLALADNKHLHRGLMISYAAAFAGAMELLPDLNDLLQLVPLPTPELQQWLVFILVADTALCWGLKLLVSGMQAPSAPAKPPPS